MPELRGEVEKRLGDREKATEWVASVLAGDRTAAHQLVEYLARSVYRFMAKMEHLSVVEKDILDFLRDSFRIKKSELKNEFKKLLAKLKEQENNPLETRAFSYLDIVSWLESKITGVSVGQVIREKYLRSIERK